LAIALFPPALGAKEAGPATPAHFQNQVRPLLTKYCYKCHGVKPKGDLRLDTLAVPHDFEARHEWDRVYAALDGRDMPPEDHPQPTPEERQLILTAVAKGLRQSHRPILVRRLSMDEIANTLADLFSLDVQTVVPLLPGEGQQGTFDHVAQRSGLTADNHLALVDGFDRLLARLMDVRDRPQPSTRTINPLKQFNPKNGKGPFLQGTRSVLFALPLYRPGHLSVAVTGCDADVAERRTGS
jgi:hypothetical protein